ncbi:MAG TPA: phage tail protein, partial [Kribbellaceae bacterium]
MSPVIVGKAPTQVRAVSRLLGREIELTWVNPPVSAFEGGFLMGTRVVRRERTFPLGPDDGELVYDDAGPVVDRFVDTGLTPLTRYYYTVFAFDGADYHAGEGSRASALATDGHGLAERLYRLLPAVHQREDQPLRPDEVHALDPLVQEGLRVLPPELRGTGQLRRFLVAATAPLGFMRSTAEALRQLHDIDRVPPEYLTLLAAFLDWRTDRTLPVYSQRNEVRAAPQLYRTVGSVPNLRSIVTRYTGWQIKVAEYAQHINRSHHAPQQNVFALRETGAGWLPASDAADLLGFAPPNTGAGLASVTGTTTGPFALAAGMELTVATDGAG